MLVMMISGVVLLVLISEWVFGSEVVMMFILFVVRFIMVGVVLLEGMKCIVLGVILRLFNMLVRFRC